jgi:hypothetical protein
MSGLNGKRAAAAGGLLYVASLVVVLVATRTSPEPKESAQKIVADLLEHRSEYAFAAYVAALQGPFLLLFAAGLGTTLAMGAAATAAALGLVGEGALAASAYHGGLDAFALHTPLLLMGGLPLALLFLAAPPPRRLPFRVVTLGNCGAVRDRIGGCRERLPVQRFGGSLVLRAPTLHCLGRSDERTLAARTARIAVAVGVTPHPSLNGEGQSDPTVNL